MDCKPDTIGFYTIDRRIGKGNFAEVRLATHRLVRSEASVNAATFRCSVTGDGDGGTGGPGRRACDSHACSLKTGTGNGGGFKGMAQWASWLRWPKSGFQ